MIGTLTSANMFDMRPLVFVACLPSKADLMPAWLLKVRSRYQCVIQHWVSHQWVSDGCHRWVLHQIGVTSDGCHSKPAVPPENDYLVAFFMKGLELFWNGLVEEAPVILICRKLCSTFGAHKRAILPSQGSVNDCTSAG